LIGLYGNCPHNAILLFCLGHCCRGLSSDDPPASNARSCCQTTSAVQRTNVYPAIFQCDVGQVKRSLKTIAPKLAQRRREIHRRNVERLTSDEGKNLPFAEYDTKTQELVGGLAKRWIARQGV
jgi:hypothetical protein